MKFTWTMASSITPVSPATATPSGDTSVFGVVGVVESTPTVPPSSDPYLIVTGLLANKFSYSVEINSVVNAPYSGMFNDLKC
jgi:hypothetical protein